MGGKHQQCEAHGEAHGEDIAKPDVWGAPKDMVTDGNLPEGNDEPVTTTTEAA